MLDLIENLFNANGYTPQKIEEGTFYSSASPEKRKAFWLIIQLNDPSSLLKRQAELFDACKNICSDDAFDKNISMLTLWNTGGKLILGEMKQKIIEVEEDPYFFKKYVLYYSSLEYEDLKKQLEVNTFPDFLKTQIVLPDTFRYYKEHSNGQNWQSLLYRIMIKIPFIDISITPSKGLASLSDNNRKTLEAAGLGEINTRLINILNDKTIINDIKSIDLVKKCKPALGVNSDGD